MLFASLTLGFFGLLFILAVARSVYVNERRKKKTNKRLKRYEAEAKSKL